MLPARALTGAARLRAVASAVPPHPDAGGAPHRGVRGPRGGAASPKRRPLSGAPPAAAPAAAAAALAAEPPSQGAALLAALGRYRALVLDASYRPVDVVNWQRAIVMDLLDRADVLEYYSCAVSSVSATFALPAVVRSRWRSSGAARAGGAGVPLNRRNIMTRDRNRCCYCGVEAAHARESLTLDHIVPTSRGGENSWTNLVTCCMPCNQKKGDKLLKQLPGWRLRAQPREPSPWELDLVLAAIGAGDARSTPEEWEGYLPAAKARPGEA